MDINQIRLTNLNLILDEVCKGNKAELARRINRQQQNVSKWWSDSDRKNIGDSSARHIEVAFKLPRSWMDNVHDNHSDLEPDQNKKNLLKIEHGDTYPIPLHHSATIDQRLRLTFISAVKGTLMLLSTDPAAYAIQLIGHNPTIWLHSHWMIVVEPNTPVSADECALIHLNTGEQLLRLVVHVGQHLVMVRNPVTGEQEPYEIGQIEKMEYAYIGIPPSKLVQE